jgi:hypothetical protein
MRVGWFGPNSGELGAADGSRKSGDDSATVR